MQATPNNSTTPGPGAAPALGPASKRKMLLKHGFPVQPPGQLHGLQPGLGRVLGAAAGHLQEFQGPSAAWVLSPRGWGSCVGTLCLWNSGAPWRSQGHHGALQPLQEGRCSLCSWFL